MPKILIVEDEIAISQMYQFKLEREGYEVATAYDGLQGLAMAQEFQPELILLDIFMPELSGDEMLEQLRSTEWGSSIRVVVLTNISRDEAPSKLRFLNVDRYIVKAHHTPAQVIQVVEEILVPPSRRK